MKIAILTRVYEFFPPMHGSARRIWSIAKNLANINNNVYLICCIDRTITKNFKVKLYDKVKVFYIPYTLSTYLQKFIVSPFLRRSRINLKLLEAFLKLNELKTIDILQVEYPYLFTEAYPIKLFLNKKLILDEHGVELDFVINVYEALGKKVKKVNLYRVKTVETLALKHSDAILVCSEYDKKRIQTLYNVPDNKMLTIPNCVDEDFFKPVKPYNFNKPTILFIGGFNHPPNYYAAQIIINQIVPYVKRKIKNSLFVFIGQNPPLWLKKTNENIVVLGTVPDVRPYIAGADVAIAPIYHGSGTRLKILEYMAYGKPVISTTKGAEGLEVKNEKHIIIRDKPEEFAEAIIELLTNKKKSQEIGIEGQFLIKEKYTWRRAIENLINFYKSIL